MIAQPGRLSREKRRTRGVVPMPEAPQPSLVHVVSSLKMGGAERVVFDLARLQLRAGFTVRVLSLGRETDALVAPLRAIGSEVVSLGEHRVVWRRLVDSWRATKPGRANVVHIHSPFGLRAMAPILPGLKAKVIYTRHGVAPLKRRRWRMLHAWGRHFVDAVTFVSAEGQQRSAWSRRGWRGPSLVIDNGVDLEVETERPPASDGRLRIGSVGRLVPLKGQQFLLEAMACWTPQEQAKVSIHFFGDGPDRDALRSLADRLMPEVPTTFHGNVIDREEIYRQVDLLAVTSRTEGLSLAIMEAMARRIPVVATRVGGTPSLVLPEETGLLVPFGDARELANALRRVLEDPDFATRLGRGGRELIQRQHSLQRTADRYFEVYGLFP